MGEWVAICRPGQVSQYIRGSLIHTSPVWKHTTRKPHTTLRMGAMVGGRRRVEQEATATPGKGRTHFYFNNCRCEITLKYTRIYHRTTVKC